MRDWLIYIIMAVAVLNGQIQTSVLNYISLKQYFNSDLNPRYIAVGSDEKIFLLDPDSRTLATFNKDYQVTYAGGFGHELDAFFDPVDLVVNNLEVIVCDQSDNRLLYFDRQLNYTGSIDLSQFGENYKYPFKMMVDPWGAVLVYFESSNLIGRIANTAQPPVPHIDLENQADPVKCVTAMAISVKGELALLLPCRSQLRLYNRFGRPSGIVPVTLDEPELLVNYLNNWIVINSGGEWQIIPGMSMGNLKNLTQIDHPILDAAVFNEQLYLLTAKDIIIIRFEIKS